jgi:Protein of unknown function (DUF2726)/Topoisomerase DNA binding C4 zinc finger
LGLVLKRILNCPERITHSRLCEVCARRSAHVYIKVRLADVLPIEGSRLSEGLFEFALQSHYDFVITDLAQKPLFAVEFDGPGHGKPVQVGRDAKKDELSRRFGLPLLRFLDNDLVQSEWRLDQLTEVTERWFDGNVIESSDRLAAVNGPAIPSFARDSNVAERPLCPVCGSGMVPKNGKYGRFLSCARFPDCRGARDLPRPSTSPRLGADSLHEPTSNSSTPRWLFAGISLVVLAITSLLFIIGRSRDDGTQASKSAPAVIGAGSATARQMHLLGLLIERRGWDEVKRNAEMGRVLGYNRGYSELSKQEASKLITAWDDRGT